MTLATERSVQQTPDQVVIIQGDWAKFKLIQQGCNESPGVRVAYFDRTIEIVMPSRPHEIFSDVFHILLSLYLLHVGIDFLGTGSADQEVEGLAATQPDRSYCIAGIKPIPDLAVEIVFSSGGPNKLARYQAIGVPEVWFWEDGTLALYHLGPSGYVPMQQSTLPGLKHLDLSVFKRCLLIGENSTAEAMREFNAYLSTLQA